MAWIKVLQRKSFSHARHIGRIGKLATHPFLARATRRPGAGNPVAGASATKPAFLLSAAESAGAIFSLLLSSVLIAAVVAMLIAFALEIRRDTFSFEGVSVPKEMLERGYSPAAVSEEVIAEIQKIQQAASTRHQKRNLESLMALPDLQLSSSGLSMNSVVRYTRRLLSLPENRISGKIFQDGSETRLLLVLREGRRSESLEVHRSDGDTSALLRDAGRALVLSVDGYVLSAYLMEQEKRSGDFTATLSAIDHVLTHPPASDHPWALELLGDVRHLQGKEDLSLEAYRTLLSLYPGFDEGPRDHVRQLVNMDRIAEARQYADKRRSEARSATQWEQVFNMMHDLGDWAAAVDAARHELVASSNSSNAYGDLLHGLGHAGRFAEALAIVEKGLAKDPKTFGPLTDGSLVVRAGRRQEGIDMARAALSRAADSGNALKLRYEYIVLGDVLSVAGKHSEALVEYEHARQRGATDDDLYFSYGDTLIAVGRPREAVAFFQEKIRQQPRVWDGHAGLARAYVATGDLPAALAMFERVTRENPLDPEVFRDWAKALDAAGRGREAGEKRVQADIAAENLKRPLAMPPP